MAFSKKAYNQARNKGKSHKKAFQIATPNKGQSASSVRRKAKAARKS